MNGHQAIVVRRILWAVLAAVVLNVSSVEAATASAGAARRGGVRSAVRPSRASTSVKLADQSAAPGGGSDEFGKRVLRVDAGEHAELGAEEFILAGGAEGHAARGRHRAREQDFEPVAAGGGGVGEGPQRGRGGRGLAVQHC